MIQNYFDIVDSNSPYFYIKEVFVFMNNEIVVVSSHKDIVDWCEARGKSIKYFNQPVVIPEGVTDCSRMFYGCMNFNQSVKIPKGVLDCSFMFADCESFNHSIFIPFSVINCEGMFYNCSSMKSGIYIDYNEFLRIDNLCCRKDLIDTNLLYATPPRDKDPGYTIENGVLVVHTSKGVRNYCEDMDIHLDNFNDRVIIAEGVTDCSEMFCSFDSFNQNVIIPSTVKNCTEMFRGCCNFNQEIIIPEGVVNCYSMFQNCQSLNKSIVIPNSVRFCEKMFKDCYNFNKDTVIPNSVLSCLFMFKGCSSMSSKITVYNKVFDNKYLGCKEGLVQYIGVNKSTSEDSKESIFDNTNLF